MTSTTGTIVTTSTTAQIAQTARNHQGKSHHDCHCH